VLLFPQTNLEKWLPKGADQTAVSHFGRGNQHLSNNKEYIMEKELPTKETVELKRKSPTQVINSGQIRARIWEESRLLAQRMHEQTIPEPMMAQR
jgi:hypothetical protein